MSNLLDRSSLVLTPTAYNNGEALCVKPDDASGDFQFSRNSAATRVNAQGLVENVQILSSNLVQNGDFSEIGAEEVSNGSFSQQGSELITNGNFTNNINGWLSYGSISTWDNGTIKTTATTNTAWIRQNQVFTINKYYKVTFKAKASNISQNIKTYDGVSFIDTGLSFDEVDTYQEFTYYLYTIATNIILGQQTVSIGDTINFDNVSVKEVGQDWTFGTGWSVSEDKAVCDGTQTGWSILQQNNILPPDGSIVKIVATVSNYSSGNLYLKAGYADTGFQISSDGTFTTYRVVNGSSQFRLQADLNFIGSVTNISVKEVDPNDYWTFTNGTITDKYNASMTAYQSGVKITPFIKTGKYKVVFDLVVTSGSCKFDAGSGNDEIYTTSGTKEKIITNPTKFEFNAFNLGWVGTLDNVSVIQITDDTNLPRINYEGFSYQDALGSEEIVNGDFSNGSDWNFVGDGSISNGELILPCCIFNNRVSQNIGMSSSKSYKLEINITEITSGDTIDYLQGGTWSSFGTQLGINTAYITNPSDATLYLRNNNGTSRIKINNVSVKEVLGQEVVPDSGCGSWLFEPQRTNFITYSENFSNSYWTKTNTTVTSGFVSPNGTNNAYKVLPTASGTSYGDVSISKIIGAQPTSVKTNSFFVKSNGQRWVYLFPSDGGTPTFFDLQDGVVGTINAGAEAKIETYSNDWYRIYLTQGVVSYNYISIGFCDGDNNPTYTQSSNSIFLYGGQAEVGSYATSYIPTEGTTVTRNQDVCTNGGSLASINSTEGVLYAEIAALREVNDNVQFLSLGSGTYTSNSIYLQLRAAANQFAVWAYSNNLNQLADVFSVTDIKQFNKIAISYKLNDFKVYVNGSVVYTNTTYNPPTANSLNVLEFTRDTFSPFFGKTKALAVYKEALSDEELTELTTI